MAQVTTRRRIGNSLSGSHTMEHCSWEKRQRRPTQRKNLRKTGLSETSRTNNSMLRDFTYVNSSNTESLSTMIKPIGTVVALDGRARHAWEDVKELYGLMGMFYVLLVRFCVLGVCIFSSLIFILYSGRVDLQYCASFRLQQSDSVTHTHSYIHSSSALSVFFFNEESTITTYTC